MKNYQDEFDVETIMYSILGTMIRYKDDNIAFTETLINQMSPANGETVCRAIELAMSLEYIEQEWPNEWRPTPEGIKAYDVATLRTEFISDAEDRFRYEALTGCNDLGKQSTIERAALPSKGFLYRQNREAQKYAHNIDEKRRVIQFMAATGETYDTVMEGLASGRIGICREGGIPHWGKFHRKGNGYRSVCARCRGRK